LDIRPLAADAMVANGKVPHGGMQRAPPEQQVCEQAQPGGHWAVLVQTCKLAQSCGSLQNPPPSTMGWQAQVWLLPQDGPGQVLGLAHVNAVLHVGPAGFPGGGQVVPPGQQTPWASTVGQQICPVGQP
jgi:hypothetical protein